MSSSRTFFVTTKTSMGRAILHAERNALSVEDGATIERAMQLVKGGFSHRLRKEYGYLGEVWQNGFSEVRVMDERSYAKHREYIAQNPVKAGLVGSAAEYPYCFTRMAMQKAQGLKPAHSLRPIGTAEAVP